jgi:hypothetical protein
MLTWTRREEQNGNFVSSGTMLTAPGKVSLFKMKLWIIYWWQSTCLTSSTLLNSQKAQESDFLDKHSERRNDTSLHFMVCNHKPSNSFPLFSYLFCFIVTFFLFCLHLILFIHIFLVPPISFHCLISFSSYISFFFCFFCVSFLLMSVFHANVIS